MADAVYPTQLEVDGDDWTSLSGGIVARVTGGVYDGLSVRGVDYTISDIEGQVPFPRLADSREPVAEGFIRGTGATEADQRASFLALRAYVFGKMRGDAEPYPIVHIQEDGSRLTIDVRPLRVEWGPDDIPTYRLFTAFWLAVGDSSTDLTPDWAAEEGS